MKGKPTRSEKKEAKTRKIKVAKRYSKRTAYPASPKDREESLGSWDKIVEIEFRAGNEVPKGPNPMSDLAGYLTTFDEHNIKDEKILNRNRQNLEQILRLRKRQNRLTVKGNNAYIYESDLAMKKIFDDHGYDVDENWKKIHDAAYHHPEESRK